MSNFIFTTIPFQLFAAIANSDGDSAAEDGDRSGQQVAALFGGWLQKQFASKSDVDSQLAALTARINDQIRQESESAAQAMVAAAIAQHAKDEADRREREKLEAETQAAKDSDTLAGGVGVVIDKGTEGESGSSYAGAAIASSEETTIVENNTYVTNHFTGLSEEVRGLSGGRRIVRGCRGGLSEVGVLSEELSKDVGSCQRR